MRHFPDEIAAYLQTDFQEKRKPFCFLIDAQYTLRNWWGDAGVYGYEDLQCGENMVDRAPYLYGNLGDASDVLPFVTSRSGSVIEVHIVPCAAEFYVVLMDASREHKFHQRRQQITNELRLLYASQQKLIQRQRALIGELVETKTELDHRRRDTERIYAEKNQFFAMMSHEFRTPLSSIINYADLALEEGISVSEMRKSAEAIARASRHMHSLVDAVLDEARLEAGYLKLNESSFKIRALFEDVAAIMAPLAAEKGLSFAINQKDRVPESMFADDVCLRQILINLVGNSVKFTETGGVQVDVDWQAGRLRVDVCDTGPGIDLADQERIFRAFERGGISPGVAAPGTGLGLTISLKLAKLMGGRIDLSSEPGKGLRTSVSVPAPIIEGGFDEQRALPEPADEYRARRPATILLCDDDEDLLTLAEHYLHRAGYGLLLARDGREAVDKALAYRPDLVLMDINIPRLRGSDAAARLRASGFSGPIVALTASDVRRLDYAAFTDCLRKPIEMPRLLAEIQSHVR